MSTLRQSLQRHRAVEPVAFSVTGEERRPALIVLSWQGDSWVLPWSHFVSARLGDDWIELSFVNATVRLTGQNLSVLLDDIAAFRLDCLRDLPPDYRPKAVEGQPFIARIEVRATGESALRSDETA